MIVTRTLPGGRKVSLEFASYDPLINKHYADTFGNQFLDELVDADPLTPQSWTELYARWADLMLAEAKAQEHYRHVVTPDLRREVVKDDDGKPKLLIPAVVKVDT